MGFCCYLCREPFNEKGCNPNKGASGDGHVVVRSISATKCGHLFHSDCLKKALESQSGNACATKLCPVCQVSLQVTDVVRVHASPYDSPAVEAQRVAAEEIRKHNQKLKLENEDLLQRLEYLYIQNRELQADVNNARREKDEFGLILDQMQRVTSMQSSEADNFRREIEKLKNIIVTLTEKLTISNFK